MLPRKKVFAWQLLTLCQNILAGFLRFLKITAFPWPVFIVIFTSLVIGGGDVSADGDSCGINSVETMWRVFCLLSAECFRSAAVSAVTSELSITTTGEASRHQAQMEEPHGVHEDMISVSGRQAAQRGRLSKLLPLWNFPQSAVARRQASAGLDVEGCVSVTSQSPVKSQVSQGVRSFGDAEPLAAPLGGLFTRLSRVELTCSRGLSLSWQVTATRQLHKFAHALTYFAVILLHKVGETYLKKLKKKDKF